MIPDLDSVKDSTYFDTSFESSKNLYHQKPIFERTTPYTSLYFYISGPRYLFSNLISDYETK